MENKLENEIGSAKWNELGPQLAKDCIIIVSSQLSLSEVASQIAEDNTETVQGWIAEGVISKPSEEDIQRWGKENPKFMCIIVKPFLLAQLPS